MFFNNMFICTYEPNWITGISTSLFEEEKGRVVVQSESQPLGGKQIQYVTSILHSIKI
jgi:hypothetical protein